MKKKEFIKNICKFALIALVSFETLNAEEQISSQSFGLKKKIAKFEKKNIIDINDDSKTDLMYKKEENLLKEKIAKFKKKNIIDINDDSKTDLMYKKEENLLKEISLKNVKISGKFHFFNSYTDEDFRSSKDNLQTLMQGDGRLNFFYENRFKDDSSVYSSFEVKKKYDNATKLKSLIGIKDKKYGDLKIGSFNPIFDNFQTAYSICVGSSGAWLRNINSSFNYPENITSPIINDIDSVIGFYTDHDLTSIMYKTPDFKGFNASVSYTNDTKFNKKVQKNFPYKNVVSILGGFEKNISKDLKFTISAMTEIGSNYQRDLNNNGILDDDLMLADLRSFLISGLVEYQKLQLVAMYSNFFKTNRFQKIPILDNNIVPENFVDPKNTYYLSLAASYKFTDKLKASISQFYSESGQDYASVNQIPQTNGLSGQVKFYSTTLGVSYEIYENSFAPYIELSKFTVKDNNAIFESQRKKDNNGYVFVLGAKTYF